MDKTAYFSFMKKTSDITDKLIQETIDERFTGRIHDLISDLPRKRARSDKPKIRPALLRSSYELAGGKDWRRYQHVAAAVELLNISTYTLNNVLDDKGGQKPARERHNECIAAMVQRELAQGLLKKDAHRLTLQQYLKLDDKFSDINTYTSGIGQYLDGNALRDIPNNYLQTYIERCQGLTGIFMQDTAQLGGILADANDKQQDDLGTFGRNYGIVIQIVNDLGDYLPQSIGMESASKVYQDQYSDLRHGCLTLPAYHILKKGTAQERAAVNAIKGVIDAPEHACLPVTKALLRTGGIATVKMLANEYARQAKRALHRFDKSPARDFLSVALSISRTNKFYNAFRALQQQENT